MTRAVVFAYHNVGVRCLKVLLAQGIDVALVVTHEDNPNENIWFGSVRQVCEENGIPFITPSDPNTSEIETRIAALGADFLFSFYYRHMLKAPLLAAVSRGAYNMHGSLLPKYRGRVPINWAVIHGETETGATLHGMTEKPDNGAIVDQVAVPILPDDTAQEVFEKVTVAAELCLHRALPALIDGTALHRVQDLSQGAYFGGRKAEDGRIDWRQNARQIHNLVRAVTRPYPGAFSDLGAGRLVLWRTRVVADDCTGPLTGNIIHNNGRLEIHPHGGGTLQILDADFAGTSLPLGGDSDRRIALPSSDS
ncbi:formyltransferase [uncultured Propionivibrio sp.]|uniref:formyltransferase n=1 Tax=uncultured Propionivibrio sp. TaxID=426737 RepID=UPI0029BFF52F|nr:formyltransferase [uncultured Propionivibrio sp.]